MKKFFDFLRPINWHEILDNDHVSIMRKKIKTSAQANITYLTNHHLHEKITLIYAACYKQSYKCLCYLLSIGTDPNQLSTLPNIAFSFLDPTYPPLYYALKNNIHSLIRLLLMHGANLELLYGSKSKHFLSSLGSDQTKIIAKQFYQAYHKLKAHEAAYRKNIDLGKQEHNNQNLKASKNYFFIACQQCKEIRSIWYELYCEEPNLIIKNYYLSKVTAQENLIKELGHDWCDIPLTQESSIVESYSLSNINDNAVEYTFRNSI